MSKNPKQGECFEDVMSDVSHSDWREFMRKLGTSENDLQEMYEKSMSKHDMLISWNQKAGLFCEKIKKILLEVAEEVRKEERDPAVNEYFTSNPALPRLGQARDLAWFAYKFIEEYPNIDAYWTDVVNSTEAFNLDPFPVNQMRKDNVADVKEAMYQAVWKFMKKNGLRTVTEAVCRMNELNLNVPVCYLDGATAASDSARPTRQTVVNSRPRGGGISLKADRISGTIIGCSNVKVIHNHHYHGDAGGNTKLKPACSDQKASTTMVDGGLNPSTTMSDGSQAGANGEKGKPKLMISYAWRQNGKEIFHIPRQIAEDLKGERYEVWIDTNDMHGYIDVSMAEAVNQCDIMIACISPAYQKSEDCLTEIRLARENRKKIVLVKVQSFKPSAKLQAYTARKLYIDFSKETFSVNFTKLLHEIKHVW